MARTNRMAADVVARSEDTAPPSRRGHVRPAHRPGALRELLGVLVVVAVATFLPLSSCSNGSGSGGGGGQGTSDGSGAGSTGSMGGSGQGGSPGTGGSGGDICAGAPGSVQNGCHTDGSDATDERGMGPQTITFGVGTDTYQPKCLHIDASQTVTFSGDFGAHPLTSGEIREAIECADMGPLSFDGPAMTKTFTLAPGVYPYYCAIHGPGGMDGLVIVDGGSGGGGSGAGGSPGTGGGGGTP